MGKKTFLHQGSNLGLHKQFVIERKVDENPVNNSRDTYFNKNLGATTCCNQAEVFSTASSKFSHLFWLFLSSTEAENHFLNFFLI